MKPTTGFLKRAWLRNQDVPAGYPAPGHLNCPCGNAPETQFCPQPDIICACGRVYTWDGWIVNDKPTYPALTTFRITYHDGTSYETNCAAGITLAQARIYFMQAPHLMADEVTQKTVINVEQIR